jgi:two-component system chemotaxis response regulator CheB
MRPYQHIVIGGSAGSFQSITQILAELPKNTGLSFTLVLHRLKHVRSGFVEALSLRSTLPVIEPEDKQYIRPNTVYLTPANYHLYIELGNYFSLSTEESVNHSRPSIDITFSSAAYSYKEKLVGILLSGANRDGAMGMKDIKEAGGFTIVQDPDECQVKTMTSAAIETTQIDKILKIEEIIRFISQMK